MTHSVPRAIDGVRVRGKASIAPIVFFWENFGPYHVDRCEAVVEAVAGRRQVIGLEMRATSADYSWASASSSSFEKRTLGESGDSEGVWRNLRRLIGAARQIGRGDYFLCHFDRPEVYLFAWWLRLTGSRAFAMFESKFDDRPRGALREAIKSLAFSPYNGALYGSPRSGDYLRFLGLKDRALAPGYDAVSVKRIRDLAGGEQAPAGRAFAERDFIAVARLVPKKNLHVLIRAYAAYARDAASPRRLRILGDGPLEAELKTLAAELGVADRVRFEGFVQTAEVAKALSQSLALFLPSTEEQFGLVVIEAMALSLPVLVSDNVGARDELVRAGVSGFVVEASNVEGIAAAMQALASDEAAWARMCHASAALVEKGDALRFGTGVMQLIGEAPTMASSR